MTLVAVLVMVLRVIVPGKVIASEAVTVEPLVRDHLQSGGNVHAIERSAVHDRVLLFVAGGTQRENFGQGLYCGVLVDTDFDGFFDPELLSLALCVACCGRLIRIVS